MKRLFRLAVQLYPSSWRQRYGSEFEALLDDLKPGWCELFDVITGAVTMQTKTLGAIPVVCALVGAGVGGMIALRTTESFASSATIRLKAQDRANAEDVQVSVEKALGASPGTRNATFVTFRGDSAHATLRLTYLDRDPAQAQRVTETLAAAIAAETNQRGASAEVIGAASLPTSPVGLNYSLPVASGSGIGFVAGCVALLLVRSRRRISDV
jgi:hypothetical protein